MNPVTQSNTPNYLYEVPNIENVASYLDRRRSIYIADLEQHLVKEEPRKTHRRKHSSAVDFTLCFPLNESLTQDDSYEEELEERLNFIEALRFAYHGQIKKGKIKMTN